MYIKQLEKHQVSWKLQAVIIIHLVTERISNPDLLEAAMLILLIMLIMYFICVIMLFKYVYMAYLVPYIINIYTYLHIWLYKFSLFLGPTWINLIIISTIYLITWDVTSSDLQKYIYWIQNSYIIKVTNGYKLTKVPVGEVTSELRIHFFEDRIRMCCATGMRTLLSIYLPCPPPS